MTLYFTLRRKIHVFSSLLVEYHCTCHHLIIRREKVTAFDNVNPHYLQEVPRYRIYSESDMLSIFGLARPLHTTARNKLSLSPSNISNLRILSEFILQSIALCIVHCDTILFCPAISRFVWYFYCQDVLFVKTHITRKHILMLTVDKKRANNQCNGDEILHSYKRIAQDTT